MQTHDDTKAEMIHTLELDDCTVEGLGLTEEYIPSSAVYGYYAVDTSLTLGKRLSPSATWSLDWVVRTMLCRDQDAMFNREEIKATARSANRDRKQFGLDSRRNWRYMQGTIISASLGRLQGLINLDGNILLTTFVLLTFMRFAVQMKNRPYFHPRT